MTSIIQEGQETKAAYDRMLGTTTRQAKIVNLLSNTILLAVFIIGIVGASRAFPGASMGFTTIALGGSYLGIKSLGCTKCAAGALKERKIDLITSSVIAALLILFGSLGAAGVLSGAALGGVLIKGTLLTIIVSTYMMTNARRSNHSD